MKHLSACLLFLYPPSWRRRYEQEFRQLLLDMPCLGAKDTAGVFTNMVRAWGSLVWASAYGLEWTLASLFFLTGMVNAIVSRTDGHTLWKATATFVFLALTAILTCAAVGFLASRRGRSLLRGIAGSWILLLVGVIIPGAVLLSVSIGFESVSSELPLKRFQEARSPNDLIAQNAFMHEFINSRQSFEHWSRSITITMMLALLIGTVATCFGAFVHAVVRRIRSGPRRMAPVLTLLFSIVSFAQAQWPAPTSAIDAYEFVNQKRVEAGKLWAAKDPKGIAMLEEMLAYLAQPLVADLAAGSNVLAARRENIWMDLAQAHALAGRNQEALRYLRQTSATFPIPAVAKFLDSREAFRELRQTPDFQAILRDFSKFEHFWDSPELSTAYSAEISEAERIAGLSKFWSEVKHNFGYPEKLVTIGWDRLYLEWIPKVQATRTTSDYYRQLMQLCARLQDGHTNVYPPADPSGFDKPPLRTALIGGRVWIVDIFAPALETQGLRKGMEILRVNGEPAIAYGRREYEPYQSAATPADLNVRVFTYAFLRGPRSQPVRLTVRDAAGAESDFTVPRTGYSGVRSNPAFSLQMLPGGIALVTLNSFEDMATARRLVEAFPTIRQTKGVILDIRGNGGGSSGVGFEILRRFLRKPAKSSRQVMRRYNPTDRARGSLLEFTELRATEIQPFQGDRFEGPVAVLAGAATYSAAEDFLVAWKDSNRGPVIGSASGGSTGQPLFFKLPGGGSARVCTKKDTYPDGREWVGHGIPPDIAIEQDPQDLQAGRDTVLERALRYIREKN
ncbi:MAG: S41 family peptidase [Bryobacteraceae bacterium]